MLTAETRTLSTSSPKDNLLTGNLAMNTPRQHPLVLQYQSWICLRQTENNMSAALLLQFIKMKLTIVQGLFAVVMFGGLILNRPVLKPLFGQAWQLEDEGWRKLTFRFGVFFIVSGVLNEIVWRTQSTDVWVNFKVFGLMGLTFMFIMTQVPMIQKYQTVPDDDEDGQTKN